MDAWKRRKPDERNSASRSCVGAALLIFLHLFASCSWRRTDTPIRLSTDSFNALQQRVAAIRGLPFKRAIPTNNFSGQSFDDDRDAQSVARLSQVYKRIGLLPDATDPAKSLADFHRLQRLTFYDSQKETITLAPDSIRLGKALAEDDTGNADNIPLVFALTQALQQQNFQWPSKLKLIPGIDRRLAFESVARGDMVLTGLNYLKGNRQALWPAQEQAVSRLAKELNSLASGLPPMLREKLIFPYREGSRFVQWAYAARGVEGINALFDNPPLSTAQVMHPEKFYLQRQDPLRIVAWGLTQQMKGPALAEQTLGEYLIQFSLASTHSRGDAARIASAWTGDHLSAYADGDNLMTCWISAWDKESSAQEFFRAFEAVLARHRGLRFETSDGLKNSLKADLAGGRAALLQMKGTLVLFLDGVASARAADLAGEIWQDLEISPEPMTFPFDLAQGRRQLASRRR